MDIIGGSKQKTEAELAPQSPEFAALRSPLASLMMALTGQKSAVGKSANMTAKVRAARDPLAGIPEYGGQMTAGLRKNEQDMLNSLMYQTGGNTPRDNMLRQTMQGGYMPTWMKANTGNYMNQGNYRDRANYENDWNYADNPFLGAAIKAAQRPTMEALTETLERSLPGRFTQAGQFTQPGGSSAFDRAAAIATRGAGNTMGDIATNMSFGNLEAERGRQFAAQEGSLGRALQANTGSLERMLSAAEGGLGRQLQAKEGSLNRQLQGWDAERNRMTQAAGLSQQEVQNSIANLQAQALPRMIKQQGLDKGLSNFQNRTQQLLQLLGIMNQVAVPSAVQTGSQTSTPGIVGGLLQPAALGTAGILQGFR